MTPRIFVSGIGTDVGKTIVSAVLVQAIEGDYWKPIQSGNLDTLDSRIVSELITCPHSATHKERYLLKNPISPHAAAKKENLVIQVSDFILPKTSAPLIIEGAGGLMVPLNNSELMIDLARALKAGVILVSKNYLGSINHTLLSIEAIQSRGLPFLGVIFNGDPNPETESVIESYSTAPILGRIGMEADFNKERVLYYADLIKERVLESLRTG